MSSVAQHMDALIGGLLALPEFRRSTGDAVWTYLALLNSANHRGVVCKRSDQIASTLRTDEPTLLADLAKLMELGLIRTLNPAPYLVIQLALWPGRGAPSDVGAPDESAAPQPAPMEVRVSSSSAAPAASATQSEGRGPGEGGSLLSRVLAVLGPEADEGEMREVLSAHTPEVVDQALRRVEATPARQIRRSRTALFRFLLTKLNQHPFVH
jgi:hypothetical protein